MSKQTATPSIESTTKAGPDSQELSIADLLQIFFHRKWMIVLATLACLLLAAVYLLVATKKYIATAVIEINKDNTMSLGLDDLSGIGSKLGTGTDLLTDMMTHQADIENESTALAVIKRMNLLTTEPYAVASGKNWRIDGERGLPLENAPNTRAHAMSVFLRSLKVELVKNTRLISVSYTDIDPVRAAAVANTIVEVYLSSHTAARYAASLKTSNWLAEQLAELKGKVADSDRKVLDFQQKAGLVGVYLSAEQKGTGSAASLPSVSSVDDERLVELNSELTHAEVERISKEALYRFAQTGDPDVLAGLGVTPLAGKGADGSMVGQDLKVLQGLRERETDLKLQYTSAATRYGPRNPELVDLTNQRTIVDEQIHVELARIVERTKGDYDIAAIAEKSIRGQVEAQERIVGRLDQSVAGLLVLEQESASNRLLYQDLYTRLEEANLSAGLGTGVITIADPARAAAKPSSPVAIKVLAAALAAGLLGGCFTALLLDQVQNILYNSEDFQSVVPFAQLGIIPDFAAGQRKRGYGIRGRTEKAVQDETKEDLGKIAWIHKYPTSPISEAYRQIRTSILMSKSASPPKTLLFTSALSGDGKTVTSFNLATAFAYQGARVLVVDADMRRPTMHFLAGCSGEVGLSNVLTGGASLAEAIQVHKEIERLSVLPAGTIPPMPAELLGSQRFADLLKELASTFDYVILDTPPLLLVTDPLLLAPMVEGVVLVSRAGRDTKPAIKSSIAMLNRPQIHMLGYVVNGASMASTYYRYDEQEG